VETVSSARDSGCISFWKFKPFLSSLNTLTPFLEINQEYRHRLALPLDVYFAKKVLR
jgi:hypothetical protein